MFRTVPIALLVVLVPGVLPAQTVTVTTAADSVDIPSQGTIHDLPGPDGRVSFAEAMLATNNTPGPQTIGFAIPRAEWILQSVFPGRAVLTSTTGYYWRASDAVTIDGTTQTAFSGDTNPAGAEVVFYQREVHLNADGSRVTGIDGSSITLSGSRGSVFGNTGRMNVTVFQGSQNLVQGNDCGTIKLDRASDNIVIGNRADRIRVLGFGSSAPARNNRIGGPTPGERNHLTGYGTWNSEGLPAGTIVQLFDTDGTWIENNWIGTTADGLAQGNPAATIGIAFEGHNAAVTMRDNLIAGILGKGQGPHHAGRVYGWAVYFAGTGSGNTLAGNRIGLDARGLPVLGSVFGIEVGHAARARHQDLRIGGPQDHDANTVAGHRHNGITVGNQCSAIRIQGNRIHDNGALGIDLIGLDSTMGSTPNDPLDADAGGNHLQNHPVLRTASLETGGTRVAGTLHSTPGSSFTIEFFASGACDPSGNGEGTRPLGTVSVTTDPTGNASFDPWLPVSVPAGEVVTATAIAAADGSTSEFSPCVPAVLAKAAWSLYGTACAGSAGLLRLSNNSLPTLGNASFAVRLDGAAPATTALWFLATRPLRLPIEGCELLIDPGAFLLDAKRTTDASGVASTTLPIPDSPGLAGLVLYGQWLSLDPASPNLRPLGGGAMSQGAALTIGQ